ncbi:APC family permease [Rhodococcus sp. EPR-157]|uniref:APC family permease n=1 Tax=Rhodococcus sp. EPR-157 TaxID=1813677 RepID=UPI000AAA295A|nr:APC family permease [Rhodococcus sp. EPR-157]
MNAPESNTTPPVVEQGSSSASRRHLKGQLGVTSIVFMVIAAAAPLTVIAGNVPIAVGLGPGAGAPVGFVIAALVLLVFAVGFVTMTPFVAEAGAFFSYVTKGLGARLGLSAAFVALVAYTAIQVGIYGYLGWAIDDLVQHYGGPSAPWWVWSVAVLAFVAVLGYRHIELSSKILGVALVLEILVVIVLDVAIVVQGGPEGIGATSFTMDAVSSGPIGIAVLFALTGFIGFEATAVFRDEARDPERTIPRATYLAVVIIGVFYAISCWALVEAWGPSQVADVARAALDSGDNMLLDTAGIYVGAVVRDLIQVLLVTSLIACVLSFHNVIARYQFALARKGVLPEPLGRVHHAQHSPYVSSVVQSVTALLFVVAFAAVGLEPLVGVFGSMAGVATVGMVILLLLTSVAVLVFFRKNPDAQRGRVVSTVVFPALAVLGLLGSLGLVLSNFTLVTGQSVMISVGLALVPVVAFVAGLVLRRSKHLSERNDTL